MARPLRVEYPGAFYHVTHLADSSKDLFVSDSDVDLFLEKLGCFALAHNIKVLSYSLTKNKFHLYLKTEDANLSHFFHSFLTAFSQVIHGKENSSGQLFLRRFKAVIVEDKEYGSALSRYIHLDPITMDTSSKLNLSQKRKRLIAAKKRNSYSAVIGLSETPKWLATSLTLKRWGKNRQEQIENYSKYVEEGLTSEIPDPTKAVVFQIILGSERFVKKIRPALTNHSENEKIRGNRTITKKSVGSFNVNTVIDAICQFYKVDRSYVLTKQGRNNEVRRVLFYLACKFCKDKYTLTELSALLGGENVISLRNAMTQMGKRINLTKMFKSKISKIEDYIIKQ